MSDKIRYRGCDPRTPQRPLLESFLRILFSWTSSLCFCYFSAVWIVGMSRTQFQPAHELLYGLKVMHIDPSNRHVMSVRCQFCVYFGREQAFGAQRARKQTSRIKTWESFRPELYESHHQGQHKEQWTIYKALDADSKKIFFEKVVPHASTLHSHFGSREHPLILTFRKDVIEVIIGSLFFNPDDPDEVSRARAMFLFESDSSDNPSTTSGYSTTIKTFFNSSLLLNTSPMVCRSTKQRLFCSQQKN